MAELIPPYFEQVEELRIKSVQFARAGEHEQRAHILLDAWEVLPLPKEQWDESYLIASYLVDSYLKSGSPEKAAK